MVIFPGKAGGVTPSPLFFPLLKLGAFCTNWPHSSPPFISVGVVFFFPPFLLGDAHPFL